MSTTKIRIYQINLDRDTDGRAFSDLEILRERHNDFTIDSSLYDRVFEGEVDCENLEDVFQMFNCDHPDGYRGRSLSVSDVVEVLDSPKAPEDNSLTVETGCYYCDSIGFEKVEFDPDKAQILKNTLRVVLVEPGKMARIAEIGRSLEELQEVVGGYIETFYPFEEEVCIVCNEEGKIYGLPLNRAIREEATEVDMSYSEMVSRFREAEAKKNGKHLTGYVVISEDSFSKSYPLEARTYEISSNNKAFQPGMRGYSIFASAVDGSDNGVRLEQYLAAERGGEDGWKIERCYLREEGRQIIEIIAGTFFICDCSGDSFGSLSEEQLKRYEKLFRYPENFARINGELAAIPYKPHEEKDKEMER